MKNEPRIPTILGLLILLIGLASAIYLVENLTRLFSRASDVSSVKELTVANVTDTEFVVAWLTDTPTVGSVSFSESSLIATPQIALDIRDQSTTLTSRITHFVKVKDLKPNTKYKAIVISSGKQISDQPLTITTGANLNPPQTVIEPSYGTLVDNNNQPVTEAIVFVSFDGSQNLASLVDGQGNWVVPLSILRTTNGKNYYQPSQSEQQRLSFLSQNGQTTVITTIADDSPLPPVKIGESYNFTKLNQNKLRFPIIAQAQTFEGLTAEVNNSFQVIQPEQNATIPSFKPAIKGVGVPAKTVTIVITNSNTKVTAQLTISQNGFWNWTPENPLSPGKYLATFTSYTKFDQPVAVARNFTILKSGTSVLGEATPSASLKPSPSPSSTPKATPKPTLSPTPTSTTSGQTTPVSGTWQPTIILFLIGLGLILASLKLRHSKILA